MILNTYGLKTSGAATNPGNLNTWLRNNGGYASGDLIIWGSVSKLGLSYQGSYSGSGSAKTYFDQNKNVILNVNKGGHYVLMTGYENTSTFYVNDPGFSKTTYAASEVVALRVYNAVKKSLLEEILEDYINV